MLCSNTCSSKAKHNSACSWTLQWDRMEVGGLGLEGASDSVHKHAWGCAHTCTYELPSKAHAVACHSPGSAAFHKSNLLQGSVQHWEIFNQVWWTLEMLFHGGRSNFIQTPSLWQHQWVMKQVLLMVPLKNTPIRMQLRKVGGNGH